MSMLKYKGVARIKLLPGMITCGEMLNHSLLFATTVQINFLQQSLIVMQFVVCCFFVLKNWLTKNDETYISKQTNIHSIIYTKLVKTVKNTSCK